MADLGGLMAGVSGGLQGLVEAYKMRLAQAEEAAKTRQSGFNAMRPQRDEDLGWARLAEMMKYRKELGGRGTTAINPITGETTEIPKGARFVTPAGASEAQKNVRTAENLLNIIGIQERRLKDLPKGRVYGRGASLINRATGLMPDVGVFQGIHEATIPVFSRVVGGDVGNLAEKEQERAAKINPNLVQTPEELAGVIGFTKEILQKKLELSRDMMRGGLYGGRGASPEPLATPPPAPTPASAPAPSAAQKLLNMGRPKMDSGDGWEATIYRGKPTRRRKAESGGWEVEIEE